MTPAFPRKPFLVLALSVGLAGLGCQRSDGESRAAAPSAAAAASPAPSSAASKPAAPPVSIAAATPAPAPQAQAAAAAGPSDLVLKDGTRIVCLGPITAALGRVVFRTPDGIQHAIAEDLVDTNLTQVARVQVPPDATAAATPIPTPASQAPTPVPAAAAASSQPGVPDFEGFRLDGTHTRLSELKGKVVLVDFWATWCMPCMMEMPNVKAVYKAHGGKDFEIMGVSLDQDKGRLAAFLKDQGIGWPQYFDGQGWGNAVSRAWGVSSIPSAFLLDRQGHIISRGMRGGDLEEAVTQAIAAKK